MRTIAILSALALFSLAQPAAAQMMCGAAQQAQASAPAAAGGMCGGRNMTANDPMADKPAQPKQSAGMCGCCKNMAMMRGGGQGGGMNMPGMEQPKQQ